MPLFQDLAGGLLRTLINFMEGNNTYLCISNTTYMKISAILFLSLITLFAFKMEPANPSKSIYDYSFKTLDGKVIKLSQFKGKKIMIVNTASECGFTPQYEQLEAVYEKYKDKLVIIGFPANDFGAQEPGTNAEIKTFCSTKFKVSFPMSEKITVKGDAMDPIYKWLTSKAMNGVEDTEVMWNFNKYLIDENGKYIAYFPSKVKPDDEKIISKLK